VSFRSARAAVNVNETGYRQHYMQHLTSAPPQLQFHSTWYLVSGKEPDALSMLVTGGIFHVQKIAIYAGGGGCIPSSSPGCATGKTVCEYYVICLNYLTIQLISSSLFVSCSSRDRVRLFSLFLVPASLLPVLVPVLL